MAAILRGAFVVDLAATELEASRQALVRAITGGALGPGYTVSLEGETVVFDGGVKGVGRGLRAFAASGGRITLSGDGRASYELSVGAAEWARVAQAVLLATLVSVTATLALDWIPTWALPSGGAVGLVWAAVSVGLDRCRRRRDLRAVVMGLRQPPGEPARTG